MPEIKINSIWNGQSPAYLGGDYNSSIAIDPDEPVDSQKRISGALVPVTHAKFSGSEVTGFPLWQVPNPTTTNTLVYASDGKIHSYTKALAMRTTDEAGTSLPISVSSAAGNGLAFYNNYYYVFKNTDVNRYGPMDGTPAMSSDWWTSLDSWTEELKIFGTSGANTLQIGPITGNEKVAQSITETTALSFNAIEVVLANSGQNQDYTVRCRITSDNSGSPNTTTLYSATLTQGSVTSASTTHRFEFGETITFTASTTYWVVIEPTSYGDLGANDLLTVRQAGASYSNGQAKKYASSAWASIDSTEDMKIRFITVASPFKALTNKTYPTIGQTSLPNHPAHTHVDNALYFGDYQGGQGMIHKIQTGATLAFDSNTSEFTTGDIVTGYTSGAQAVIAYVDNDFYSEDGYMVLTSVSGTFQDNETIEGASSGHATVNGTLSLGVRNYGSAYSALDLPYGYYPVAIESYGNDLAVLANQATDTEANQGPAALFLWDTFSPSFYRQIKLPFPLGTALKNHQGKLEVFGGNGKNGYMYGRYYGGDQLEEVAYIDDGLPPFPGAVTTDFGRVVWGTTQEYPTSGGAVLGLGSRNPRLPKGIHNIAKANSSGTSPQVLSLNYATQTDTGYKKLIIGWGTSSAKGLDKPDSTATQSSVFRSEVFSIGKKFQIKDVILPLAKTLASNMTIVPKIYIDDAASSYTLNTVNSTNYTGKVVHVYPTGAIGEHNFFLELSWTGTTPCPVNLPITIVYEELTT